MDKGRIKRTRDLLYENSVSLATAAVFKLEEDILSKKENFVEEFGDVGEFW